MRHRLLPHVVLALFVPLAIQSAACAEGEGAPALAGKDGGADVRIDTSPVVDTGTPPPDTTVEDTGSPDDTAVADTKADVACTVPTGKTCTTFPQCGCPTRNCDVIKADGTTGCITAGTLGLHDKCSSFDRCKAGFACAYGICQTFCGSDSDCTGALCKTLQTIPSGSTTPVDIPGDDVCFEKCDPRSPSAVCGGGGCLFVDGSNTICHAAGTATGLGVCKSAPFVCTPGFICVNTGDCKQWCRIGFPGDCPGGATCGPLTSSPHLSGVEYGVCP